MLCRFISVIKKTAPGQALMRLVFTLKINPSFSKDKMALLETDFQRRPMLD